MDSQFLAGDTSLASQFRSIYLLGANTASYKFALAKALLSYQGQDQTFVSLDELTPIFAQYLLEHVQTGKRQINGTGGVGKMLNVLTLYSLGQITEQQMLQVVRVEGFKCVLDAFHRLPNRQQATPFFHKSILGKQQGISLTDELFDLTTQQSSADLTAEIEGRWCLVESAWSENSEIIIEYDLDAELLYYLKPVSNSTFMHSHLRTNLSYVRGPLNGYQKGKCFYCYRPITIESNQATTCDVDHVIPMSIQYGSTYDLQLNEAWNLVLACQQCNRWEAGGKAGNMPLFKFIESLYRRNEYLIASAHPLRENILRRTGRTTIQRKDFLRKRFEYACSLRAASWQPKEILGGSF
ncbi:HNH endonuclease [Thiopseudomonas alkaliphila]|uniref:HNH endonuclease n=1 Tax=Thiopseudomonas alkaliphila TaxID=1697053 RepID=A0AAW7DQQ8_9GAMM|nr:HNH endonuclease [Thiopseudomonas alkaliphila]MDM1696186.1 HNH endonuclease [Thiopseudomonas alkaliphila]